MNNTLHYHFTVIVPVYNEEEGIARLATALGEFIAQGAVPACVLFFNEGSTDNSKDLIKKECEARHHFFYLCFDGNRGLSAAIKAGIDYAESQWVGYIDADLQTDPLDFNLLLRFADEYPLVTGVRMNRRDTWSRRMQSLIANAFRRMMTGDDATDTGCPLKVIQTSYAKRLPLFTGMHRFLPALIMLQRGGHFKELPVKNYPRTAGESKFHLRNRLVAPFIDCFAYRWMKGRAINYEVESNDI